MTLLDQYNLSDWKQNGLFLNKEYKIGCVTIEKNNKECLDKSLVLFRRIGDEHPYIAHLVFIEDHYPLDAEEMTWTFILNCKIKQGERFDVKKNRISGFIYPQNYSLELEIKYLYQVWIDSNIRDINYRIENLYSIISSLESKKETLNKEFYRC